MPETETGITIYSIQEGQYGRIGLGKNNAITLLMPGGTAYGLVSGSQSYFTADNFDITLSTTFNEHASGIGVDISDSVDFGNNFTVTVHGLSERYGMIVEDYLVTSKDDAIGTMKANHLIIGVTGQKTEGP